VESLYLLLVIAIFSQQAATTPERAGDVYDVRYESTTKGQTDTGSSSSRSRNALVERVVRMREDGIELVFDLPEDATEADRLREWQFPARVLKAEGEPFQLLNEEEIAQRKIAWRDAADISEEYCGRWYFTWNAF